MTTSGIYNQKTIQQIIDETAANSGNTRKTGNTLGKDDFLNLLVTQLRYQDPLQPTDDKEFIGQMAQFSALEQMQNMNGSLSQSQAFTLIGKYVTANRIDEATSETTVVQGRVTSVNVSNGKVQVIINGESVPVGQITDVSDNSSLSSTANLASYTSLFGNIATGAVYDSDNGDIVAVKGKVKSVQKGVYEDYAVMDGVDVQVYGISGEQSTDPNYRTNYLDSHMKSKQAATIIIEDESTGRKVSVTATIRSYKVLENGDVTAVLDDLQVPVESVVNISPAPADEEAVSEDGTEDDASDDTTDTGTE